jgi:DDE superfamily endonuclease
MDPESVVITSASGFTNDQIAIEFLKHLIMHTDAGPHSEWKLLLMNNHGSYETAEFAKLANENHILPYPLIPHLTHCMQPLDVGIFQPYKHWHDVAIQDALANLEVEYSI